jgi:ribosomal-protein-alanine N-acetyltransferase
MGDVIIRGMLPKDIDQIADIESICFSLPWSKASFENELRNELAYYQVAEVADKVVAKYVRLRCCHSNNLTIH